VEEVNVHEDEAHEEGQDYSRHYEDFYPSFLPSDLLYLEGVIYTYNTG